jgi:hypothetical protein
VAIAIALSPIVWRVPFSTSITNQLISNTSPRGSLTNSCLKMATVLLHYMALQQEVGLRLIRTCVWSDNTPTVTWTKRMADHSQAPTSERLGIFSESIITSCKKAMATKQGAYRQTSAQMLSWAFTNPDFVPPGKTKSLRMRIFSLKYEDKPLFHGLTPESRGTG